MSPFLPRNATFDFAKLLSVIGIVWFHTGAPNGSFGHAGLMYIVMLLIFLALPQIAMTRTHAPFGDYAYSRGLRLLVPFLICCGVYGALKITEAVITGAPLSSEFHAGMWPNGTAPHLWVLPFGFVMCLCIWPLARVTHVLAGPLRLPVIMWLTICALIAQGLAQPPHAGAPLVQWLTALPAVFLALGFALTGGHPMRIMIITGIFGTIAGAAGWTAGLMAIGLGAMGITLACAAYIPATQISAFASRAAFGIYLIHPAIASLLDRGGVMTPQTTAFAIAVLMISLAIVVLWETMTLRPILKPVPTT